jgi:hypothetical protein
LAFIVRVYTRVYWLEGSVLYFHVQMTFFCLENLLQLLLPVMHIIINI